MKQALLILAGFLFFSIDGNAHTLGSVTKNVESSISEFSVVCYDDGNGNTDKYSFQIRYTSNLPVGLALTVKEVEGTSADVTVVADKSGVFSPWGYNKGGNGAYKLTVTKIKNGASALGKIGFTIEHHCTAANGAHTGTSDSIDVSPPGQDDPNPPPVDPETPPQPAKGTPGFSGSLSNKTDKRRYAVACSAKKINGIKTATDRYRFWVKGATKTSPYHIQMKVSKGEEAVAVVDLDSTDNVFSEPGVVAQGDGQYTIEISKLAEDGNTAGSHTFSVKHECLSESGARTTTGKPKPLR